MCNAFWRPDGSFGWCKNARKGVLYQHTKECEEEGVSAPKCPLELRPNEKKLHSLDVPGVKRMDYQAEKELSGQERRWNDILKGWETERSAPNVQNSS